MLKRLFENFVLKATDWLFRTRSIEAVIMKSALASLVAIFGAPPLIAVLLRIGLGSVPEGYLAAQAALDLVDGWILIICSIIIAVALVLIVLRRRSEVKILAKKRVIVIEARGLRDDDGSPLEEAIKGNFNGQIIPVLLDLRNRLDGKTIEPERAIDDIYAAHRSVLQHEKHLDRSDVTVVYGGLTSVPYTFLTGVLLDDEGLVNTFDWDRTQERWRDLKGEDDGLTFEMSGIEGVTDTQEVLVAVTFSYPVNRIDLESTFSFPIVDLRLDGMSSDTHWSSKKQNRLAQQFFEVVKALSSRGVKRIHVVMAAPNSVVFNFGRRYDKRNLPELVVYQYERGQQPAYPWGVLMPVAGYDRPQVLYMR